MLWLCQVAVIWLIAVGTGDAKTLRVPDDFSTVLAAADAASPGDTVIVGPGVWTDLETRTISINGVPQLVTSSAFLPAGIVLRGAGPGLTTIDCGTEDPGEGSLLAFVSSGGAGLGIIEIEDLELTGARRPGGRLLSIGSVDGVVVSNCRLTGCEEEAGVASFGDTIATLRDCWIGDNECGRAIATGDASLVVERCEFVRNRRVIQFLGEFDASSTLRVADSRFALNRAASYTCLDIFEAVDFEVVGCTFVENTAYGGSGGGAAVRVVDSVGSIGFCVFDRDSTDSIGGGVLWDTSSGRVVNCTFVGCFAGQTGAAAVAFSGSSMLFKSNVVAYSSGGEALATSNAQLEPGTGCNVVWLNQGGTYRDWEADDSDIEADPLFCKFPSDDYTVQAASPCVVSDCALVGAFGIGCDPVSIEGRSWSGVKALFR